jgi:hypothetical protein
MILVSILYDELHKEMGWNLETVVELNSLWIGDKKEVLVFPSSLDVW